jgi:hypothetical protein
MGTVIKKIVMNNIFTKKRNFSKPHLINVIMFLSGVIVGGILMMTALCIVGMMSYWQ